MNITLYRIDDPNNKVVKNTSDTSIGSMSGVLKEDTSLLNPSIIVDATAANINVHRANYAYIDAFDRYYFIKDIITLSNDLFEIVMHVDVLNSWANGLKAAPCIVARNQNDFSLYLMDSNYKCFQNDYVLITKATGGFPIDEARFVVTIFGDKEWGS